MTPQPNRNSTRSQRLAAMSPEDQETHRRWAVGSMGLMVALIAITGLGLSILAR